MPFLQQVMALRLALLALAHGQLTEQDIDTRLSSEVVAPFQNSTTHYNEMLSQLWSQLQGYDPESTVPIEITESVKEQLDGFIVNLHTASNSSKTLQNDMFNLVAQQTEQVSAIERDIVKQNDLIANANARVQTSQNAVNLAATGLNNANNDAATRRAALQEAERSLDKAKNDCFGKRRRKRAFWGDVWEGVKNVASKVGDFSKNIGKGAYKGICHGVGALTGKIGEEKDRLRVAEGRVAQTQANLKSKQTELDNAKNALAAEQQKVTNLQQQQISIQTKLTAEQEKKESLVALNIKMMKTVEFLDGMLVQGGVLSLTAELGYILDIDNVFNPLKDIGINLQQLGAGGEGGFVPTVSEEQVLQMEEIMGKINTKKA